MKIHYYSYAVALLLLCFTGAARAQAPGLSQYWLAPQLNTPAAMAGSDYLQISSHYRKQALNEEISNQGFVLNGQMPLYHSDNKRLGTAGLSLMQDRNGPQGFLVTNGVVASYSYDVSLSSLHHLVGGLQAGYFLRSLNWSNVTTDAQWQWGNYDPNAYIGESWSDERSGAFQANVGLGYYMMGDDGSSRLQISAGAYNVNRGGFTYQSEGDGEALPLRIAAFASGLAVKNIYFDLSPMLRWQLEAGLSTISAGGLFRKGLKEGVSTEKSHIGLCILYSPSQAGSFTLQLAQPSFILAIGYDLALGKADPKSRNAIEATLGWRLNRLTNKGTNSFREVY